MLVFIYQFGKYYGMVTLHLGQEVGKWELLCSGYENANCADFWEQIWNRHQVSQQVHIL